MKSTPIYIPIKEQLLKCAVLLLNLHLFYWFQQPVKYYLKRYNFNPHEYLLIHRIKINPLD